MNNRFSYNSWSLVLQPEWQVTEHPECITFERSQEGALQLSSAKKSSGLVLGDELVQYAESQNAGWGVSSPATCGDFSGVVYRYQDDEMQCNRWFLRNDNTLLFVTYFGSDLAQALEYPEVEKILATLRAVRPT